MINKIVFLFLFLFLFSCCNKNLHHHIVIEKSEQIKSYCLDFNWGYERSSTEGGPNYFAAPGLWADAEPKEHIKWYKDLGVNVIQTFAVSCNGYAWYKDGIVPEQTGLKHDFLTEMVRLGHKEGMKVMGYFCAGANTRWGRENPDYSYGFPSGTHIPFTNKYLEFLSASISDALIKTDMDGFMIDWIWQPDRKFTDGKWLVSEIELYEELMNQPFPKEEYLSEEQYLEYSRKAIDRCWQTIYTAAKKTKPSCIIWLTCAKPKHPHVVNSRMYKEVDWWMNEAGDIERIEEIRDMVGVKAKLITCLANFNSQDPKKIIPAAQKAGIGLFGYTKPDSNSLRLPIKYYLSTPIDSFKMTHYTDLDHKNIAALARTYNNYPLDFLLK